MTTHENKCCKKCEIWDRNSPNFDPPRSEGYVWNGTQLGIHECPCHTPEYCRGVAEEKKFWLEGKRCNNCGGEKHQDSLSDLCPTCLEEE